MNFDLRAMNVLNDEVLRAAALSCVIVIPLQCSMSILFPEFSEYFCTKKRTPLNIRGA